MIEGMIILIMSLTTANLIMDITQGQMTVAGIGTPFIIMMGGFMLGKIGYEKKQKKEVNRVLDKKEITIRVPDCLLKEIDKRAKRITLSREDMIELILEEALSK